jgi:two-component system cell cycle sensor histidine kinase/response regulator CckA
MLHKAQLRREIIEGAGEGIVVYDRELRYLVWNPFMERLTGMSADEVLGKAAPDLFPHIREQRVMELLERALAGEQVTTPDLAFYVPKTGRRGWVSSTYGPHRNSKGEIIGVTGIVRDITDRRESEQALRYRSEFEAIMTGISTRFINLATEEIDSGISEALEKIGRFVDADRSYFFIILENGKIYSRTHEWCVEGVEPQIQHCQRMPVDAYPWFSGHVQKHKIVHVPSVAEMSLEAAPEQREFQRQSVQSLACVPAIYRGHVIGFLGFDSVRGARSWSEDSVALLRNVGETIVAALQRKWAEEALRRSEEQLRQSQKMEAIGRLAGGIAHDFNNLLTAIIGYSDLLVQDTMTDKTAQGRVHEIKKAAHRAASLTNQLLAFSRKQVLTPRVLDLNAVVQDMENFLRRLIGESIELVTKLDPDVGSIKADPTQLQQVMMNLAVNARDAMLSGGRLEIRTENVQIDPRRAEVIGLAEPGAYVRLSVIDTGHGMDAETQARIFEPFFTTKEQNKGVGLGLATVYGIVQQSGGVITIRSKVGAGTVFKIYLRRTNEPAEVIVRPSGDRALPRGSETILLVEDEESVRALLRQLLQVSGYRVLEASNGMEALNCVEAHAGSVDLLVTDIVMPVMGGRELAEKLQKSAPHLPVIFMSGYANDPKLLEEMRGPCSFIPKPFTVESLAVRVREMLD